MADNEQKAKALIDEAEKKLSSTSKGLFSSLFSSGASRVQEAIECYQRGGNLYKISKKFKEAGNAYAEAAKLHAKLGTRHEAATTYVDASNCYKKCSVADSVDCLLKAIEIYTDLGRFTMVAKHHQSIAEIYESDDSGNHLSDAVSHYEKAADYFQGEESNSSANKCLLMVAKYSAKLENYDKAIKIYEEVGTSALENTLLKYSARDYFFKAALCHLCVDPLNATHALERYIKIYPAFKDQREFKFIKGIIDTLEEQNPDAFTELVQNYDSISSLDPWMVKMLLKVRQQFNEEEDLR